MICLTHCGGCGMGCAPANATGVCTAGGCGIASCNAGFADCDGNPANGCEVNTQTKPANCGACGNVCSIPNGAPACATGTCRVANCSAGFADCNAMASDGCETNTNTSNTNCSGCGVVCAAGQSCSSGTCVFGSGAMGPLNVMGTVTVNASAASVNASAGSSSGTLSNVTGMISVGRLVLLHQTQGSAGVGQYEYARVATVVGSMIGFDRSLTNSYTTSGGNRAQLIVVEEYTSLTMAAGSTLTAPA